MLRNGHRRLDRPAERMLQSLGRFLELIRNLRTQMQRLTPEAVIALVIQRTEYLPYLKRKKAAKRAAKEKTALPDSDEEADNSRAPWPVKHEVNNEEGKQEKKEKKEVGESELRSTFELFCKPNPNLIWQNKDTEFIDMLLAEALPIPQ